MKRCTMEFRRKPFIVFYDIKSLRINSKSYTLSTSNHNFIGGTVSLLSGKFQ